jgi:hypothetical protein
VLALGSLAIVLTLRRRRPAPLPLDDGERAAVERILRG